MGSRPDIDIPDIEEEEMDEGGIIRATLLYYLQRSQWVSNIWSCAVYTH